MKRTSIAFTVLFLAITTRAALIEYDYAGKDAFIYAGSQPSYAFAGVMIFDTISSNVTFVDWRNTDHTYYFDTVTNFHFVVVSGRDNITHTVIASSGSGIDSNGYYYLNDYMISGQNAELTISSNAKVIFPVKFSGSNNRNIAANSAGAFQLKTWGERMTFSPARTIPDNNNGLTASNVLDNIISELQSKGYTHP
ncbi:MAG TPA: hypothetical protein VMP11_01070 [Verrucomicrobiae bacterium]|nr:hypothetical protein [Verrucomicrobiae bacterium]